MPQKKDFTSVYICDVRVQEFHKYMFRSKFSVTEPHGIML